ncbi:helix-turn-helix domain-containing protein [Rhodococcus sp. USK13]|uniref:helix-turn-helix domain-containing protein n=1 Tax=Rhodococcus sp. USK13 TaxID=2806442 RepID=UPI001BCE58D8|nr:helix-turn-helix domain-containing protein [Rhodococcus sp. USK13]
MDTTGLKTPPAYLAGAASYREWVEALASITRAVNDDLPERGVGDLIARACARLVGVDRVAVQIRGKEANTLRLVGATGLSPDYVEKVNNQIPIEIDPTASLFTGSPSSRVFRGRRSLSIADIHTSASFAPWKASAEAEGFRSMFAAPLVTSKSTLGVLVCYNDAVGRLTPAQRELTELLADHAALALESFQLRREQAEVVEQMAEAMDQLRRDRSLHRDLMELVLGGGSDEDILQSAAQSLGLKLTHGSNHAPSDKRVVISVAGEHFGSIEAEEPLDYRSRRALESVGLVIALERRRLQVADEVGNRHATELLNEILTSDQSVDVDELNDRALRLGFRLDLASAVMVFRTDTPVPKIARRVAEIVRSAAEGAKLQLIASYRGDLTVVLVPETVDHERAARFLHTTVNQNISATTVSSVLGPPCATPQDLASSFKLASAVLRMRQKRSIHGKMLQLDEIGALGLLLPNLSDETVRFSDNLMAPLTDAGSRASESLLPTLRSYLANNRSTLVTAQELSVHQNTVANRLERISKLTGKSLENTEHILDFTLAILIRDVLDADQSQVTPPHNQGANDR